jgi:hypothetical protein
MNNIVLYRFWISLALLVLFSGLEAQRPAIVLIPSAQHIRPTEAIIDTSQALDSMILKNIFHEAPAMQEEEAPYENVKKERRQIGPSMDSLLRRTEGDKVDTRKAKGIRTLAIRKYNPFRIFIRITAIK